MLSKWMTQWDALKAKVGGVAAGQSSDAVDPAGTASRSAAEGALYSFDSLENLQKRLELRDVFRDERLFQSLLPRADSPLQRWTREGPLKTRVDHWSPTSQFIPMDQQRILMSCAYAGVLVAALTTPLEVMKNKWIFSPEFQGVRSRMSTREVCRHVYRAYGWRTFFTGFGATLCTVIPANLTYFFFYEQMRYQEPPATAGMKARVFTAVLTSPIEYVRTRLQANAGEVTTRQLLRTITHLEGLFVFSKGVIVTVLRDAPFSALYWTLNEKGKQWVTRMDPAGCSDNRGRPTLRAQLVYPLAVATASATLTTVLTHPLDVVKTMIQGVDVMFKRRGVYYQRYNGILSMTAEVYHSQGWRGFTVGLTPRLLKVVPSSVLLLGTYDLVVNQLLKPPSYTTALQPF